RSYGTFFFPLAMALLSIWVWQDHPRIFMAAVLLLAIGDPLAALGSRLPWQSRPFSLTGDKKTLAGSALLFAASLVISVGVLTSSLIAAPFNTGEALAIALLVAVPVTLAEALGSRGSDNLLIPLVAALVLLALVRGIVTPIDFGYMLTGSALAGLVSLRVGFLNPGGAAAAFFLALFLTGFGGLAWIVPMLTFFVLSSLLSRLGPLEESKGADIAAKGHRRDHIQVLANGGLPGILVILNGLYPNPIWYPLFLTALAAATADTWGSEIGMRFGHLPRSILYGRILSPGQSGGITLPGTLASLGGALILAASALPFHGPSGLFPFWAVVVAGFWGSILDSLLGATLQVQFSCQTCGKITERAQHCGQETRQYRGIFWMDNDLVNLLSILGAAITLAVYL
ncbi:MAG TPA: DUF92 domain-containing protein, partial [Calditrichia bacterium]|nr:DUF92 domain-containing protein [Calditrichia bacterium]